MRRLVAKTLEWLSWVLEDVAERLDAEAASEVAQEQSKIKRAPLAER